MKRKIVFVLLLFVGLLSFCESEWNTCSFYGSNSWFVANLDNPAESWEWNLYKSKDYVYQYFEFFNKDFQFYIKRIDGILEVYYGKYNITFNEDSCCGIFELIFKRKFCGKNGSAWEKNSSNKKLLFRTEGTIIDDFVPVGDFLYYFLDITDSDGFAYESYTRYDMDRLFANNKSKIIECKFNANSALKTSKGFLNVYKKEQKKKTSSYWDY